MKTEKQRQDDVIELIQREQRRSVIKVTIVCVGWLMFCVGLSLWLATIGRPTEYWLWHDILGVL